MPFPENMQHNKGTTPHPVQLMLHAVRCIPVVRVGITGQFFAATPTCAGSDCFKYSQAVSSRKYAHLVMGSHIDRHLQISSCKSPRLSHQPSTCQ